MEGHLRQHGLERWISVPMRSYNAVRMAVWLPKGGGGRQDGLRSEVLTTAWA